MWAWIGVVPRARACEARGGGTYAGLNASAATFVVIAIGALGCWVGGWASDRWGRTALTMIAMAASGVCALAIGLTFGGPPAADPARRRRLGHHRHRRLRAVLDRGDRAVPARLRRHRAHHADLRRLRPHHAEHLADPARGAARSAGDGPSPRWPSAPSSACSPWGACAACPRPRAWRAAAADGTSWRLLRRTWGHLSSDPLRPGPAHPRLGGRSDMVDRVIDA